jgi:hypothetical protein
MKPFADFTVKQLNRSPYGENDLGTAAFTPNHESKRETK